MDTTLSTLYLRNYSIIVDRGHAGLLVSTVLKKKEQTKEGTGTLLKATLGLYWDNIRVILGLYGVIMGLY